MSNETLTEQAGRVLQAFMDAPGHALTTGELEAIPYLANWRARQSDLRKLGHVFTKEHIAGTNSYRHYWKGLLGEATPPELKYLTTILISGSPVQVWC